MTQPPAGWYPDPQASATAVRWWDGQRWTEHAQLLHTGPTTEDGVPLAGWWQRVGAYLLDTVIILLASLPVQVPAQLSMHERTQDLLDRMREQAAAGQQPDFIRLYGDMFRAMHPALIWVGLASLVLWGAYEAVLLRWKGQTVGMMALSIRVRHVSGDGRLTWGTIGRRWVGQFWPSGVYLLPLGWVMVVGFLVAGVYGWLDPLWATWDKRNQTLHDKIAGTVVVRLR